MHTAASARLNVRGAALRGAALGVARTLAARTQPTPSTPDAQ